MAKLKDDFLDDGVGKLPEGAGGIICVLAAAMFWLGFGAGLAVSALLS